MKSSSQFQNLYGRSLSLLTQLKKRNRLTCSGDESRPYSCSTKYTRLQVLIYQISYRSLPGQCVTLVAVYEAGPSLTIPFPGISQINCARFKASVQNDPLPH